ncbi:hypothetical protein T07_3139 [Trichinella nelsoni]|uniref:Uncharacterized protein n=1 Tax=Trichinella nelsoni TaxID=6336 RepID=A0A0V0S0X7_9BILA|nr:hypothetical protein T07_3139 [Trichinella nelsoni]
MYRGTHSGTLPNYEHFHKKTRLLSSSLTIIYPQLISVGLYDIFFLIIVRSRSAAVSTSVMKGDIFHCTTVQSL